MKRAERIAEERARLNLRPWELSPSEGGDGACPWPEGTGGAEAWARAKAWRAEIRARDPHYFAEAKRGRQP